MRWPRLVALSALAGAVACATSVPPAIARLRAGSPFSLAGHVSLPPLARFPPIIGTLVGGLSAIVPGQEPGEFLALSDDRVGSRVFVLRIEGSGPSFAARITNVIPLAAGAGVPQLDPEGLALTPDGRMYISSEGIGSEEPRIPPAILEYSTSGAFVRTLPLRERFVPEPTGPPTRGVRPNLGFEALTITPDGERLFTATESSLVQDGAPATFEAGARARLLEYRASGGTFEPAREFLYPLDAMEPAEFTAAFSVAGLVELLALSATELVALERTYIEEAGNTGRGLNRARLFRITIDGASDVSALESVADRAGLAALRKTPLADLSTLAGLPPELAALDNFEGMTFGPVLEDGTPTLLVISDDNFNEGQRSWVLLIGLR
jgi:3-phytase/alkaline phosphatase D